MKARDCAPGTRVVVKSGGKVIVGEPIFIGSDEYRTSVYCQSFKTEEDYKNLHKVGMLSLDAEVEIV